MQKGRQLCFALPLARRVSASERLWAMGSKIAPIRVGRERMWATCVLISVCQKSSGLRRQNVPQLSLKLWRTSGGAMSLITVAGRAGRNQTLEYQVFQFWSKAWPRWSTW